MIVKILKTSGSFPAIEYNEKKVQEGVAERVELRNFGYLQDNPEIVSADSMESYLSVYSETGSNHLKYPQFHVAFSCKGHEMTKEQLLDFANLWLQKMGYAENPMVIYFHRDTDNNHLHIITSRVGRDGKKINDHHERRRSQQAINEILGVEPKKEAENIVDKALTYSFQSIGQFRSILESSSYESYEENDNLQVKKGGGVIFTVPMAKITNAFTLDDDEKRRKRAAQIRAWLLRYKAMCYDKEELAKLMHAKFGVNLIFHGKGIGGKEFKPYGYTVVDHSNKIVFKGSDVLPLKQLLEFITYSREEKEKEVNNFIDDAIQKNYLITTRELNKLLKVHTNAYVSKGQLILNGVKQPLRENVGRILKINDRIAWVQSFNPRNVKELNALAAMFKVNTEDLSVKTDNNQLDANLVNQIKLLASESQYSNFRDNLSHEGFSLFKHKNEYYVLSFKHNFIATAKECGVGENLLEPPVSIGGPSVDLGGGMDNLIDGIKDVTPNISLGGIVETVNNVLSIGDTGTGGIGGGGPKDLSKKKKKKKDEQESSGFSY